MLLLLHYFYYYYTLTFMMLTNSSYYPPAILEHSSFSFLILLFLLLHYFNIPCLVFTGSGWGVGTSLDKMIAMQAQMDHFATALEGMHDTVTSCQVVLQQLVDGTYVRAYVLCYVMLCHIMLCHVTIV